MYVDHLSSDLKLTASILSSHSASLHPLDQQYNSLNARLTPLDEGSAEFEVLQMMAGTETEGERGLWRLQLEDAFAVERDQEGPFEADEMRKLVWHGARATHWARLIAQGLHKAEAGPRSGRTCTKCQKLSGLGLGLT